MIAGLGHVSGAHANTSLDHVIGGSVPQGSVHVSGAHVITGLGHVSGGFGSVHVSSPAV